MLTQVEIDRAAQALHRVRTQRDLLDGLPQGAQPASLAEAYAIQRSYDRQSADPVVGYKIGAASAASQKLVGASEPFLARVHASLCFDAPASLAMTDFFSPGVEAEFAFELGQDLPARERPYDADEVAAAIVAVRPIVEICDNRFRDWRAVSLMELIADNGFFGALVVGERRTDWRDHDLGGLEVVVQVDGEERGRARCKDVLGAPVDSVVWMANMLSRQSIGMKRGHLVPIGTWTGLHFVKRGTKVNADFGPLGTVDLTFQ